jgi:hypothetical protein
MRRARGVGWGLVSVGSLFVIKSGMSADAAEVWVLIGLVLLLFGAVLIGCSRLRRRNETGERGEKGGEKGDRSNWDSERISGG